jgi:hypothetical protein
MRHVMKVRFTKAAFGLPVFLGASLLGVAGLSAPALAADQLVAFDETYVQELNGNVQGETFHHGIVPKATEPDSWITPVNYSKGTAYLYMEVLEKPSKRNTLLTVCFDGPKAGYGCFDTKIYTDVGAYETKITMGGGGWYQYNKIAWGQRRDDYHLVIKDPALNGIQGGRPPTDYVPTKLRVVLTVVPPGGTYVPPAKGMGMAGDGGAVPADAATGGQGGGSLPPPVDASPTTTDSGGPPPKTADAATTGGSGGKGGGGSGSGGSGDDPTGGTGGSEPGGKGRTKSGGCRLAGDGPGATLPLLLAGACFALVLRRGRRKGL